MSDKNKRYSVAEAWNRLLETQLIIRVHSYEVLDSRGFPEEAECQIRIISFDEETPAGTYEIRYSQTDPSSVSRGEPIFDITRYYATSNASPVEQAVLGMDSCYDAWIDRRPFVSVTKTDYKDSQTGLWQSTSNKIEHLSIRGYAHMLTLHALLECRVRFNFSALSNSKVLGPTVAKLGGFLAAERTNLAKIKSLI
jgi:hypothetical protein